VALNVNEVNDPVRTWHFMLSGLSADMSCQLTQGSDGGLHGVGWLEFFLLILSIHSLSTGETFTCSI